MFPNSPLTLPALASTGVIWAYYATLVKPRADMLFIVSVALLGSNGWNVYRKLKYDPLSFFLPRPVLLPLTSISFVSRQCLVLLLFLTYPRYDRESAAPTKA